MMRQKFSIDAVFDIETTKWTDYVLGAFMDLRKNRVEFYHNERDLFERILYFNGSVWGHNAGRFDTLWFLKNLMEHTDIKPQLVERGSSILILRIGKMQIVDSMGLIPFSLRKAATIVGSEKLDMDYQAIKPWNDMNVEEKDTLIEYLRRDVELLAQILKYIQTYARQNGIALKYTVGSTSWATAQARLGLPKAQWVPHEYEFVRSGYYGGRCEVFRMEVKNGHRYDRNSSYPASLKTTRLPVGERMLLKDQKYMSLSFEKYEGIFECTVTMPEMFVPVLPYRVKKRLYFPIGTFRGTWARNELIYAIEQGAKIEKIHKAYVWKTNDNIFEEYINWVWDLRKNAESEGMNKWLKWIANSLTGKFAEKPEKTTVRFVKPESLRACDGGIGEHDGPCPPHKCCAHRCVGACHSGEILSSDLGIVAQKHYRIPANAYPHFAAYLTADARISLHKQLSEGNPIYCDTDSCYKIENEIADLGDELGQWGYEGKMSDWKALAPKLYRYHDQDGNEIVRGKGLTGIGWDGITEIEQGKGHEMPERPATFRTSLRRQLPLFSTMTMTKHHKKKELIGDRKLEGNVTYPLDAKELKE